MKSDIEIAQACEMKHIRDIAAVAGVEEDYLEYYGKYKAKIDLKLLADRAGRPDGKLVLVTAINPTPAGEGKTTTTVGLGQAMKKIGKNAVIDTCIIDENTVVNEGVQMGLWDNIPNEDKPKIYHTGITVVGEDTVIPPGMQIGKNCVIYGATTPEQYPEGKLPSGQSIILEEVEL